ncbi:leucyl aminopeptidase family protein [Chitinispirillales bacterium ANBcel5]|uniref:leucyl aminopeptidase family protein n=1 Tax=Cellulosispirillum alkaliphilum TaxID=3039283 RepID=UPI002A4F9DFA|nr:leucyl aminopeptidase family protein [Chitinispirillales bacterium ANBcel5]
MKINLSKTAHFQTQIIPIAQNSNSKIVDFSGKKTETALRYEGESAKIYCGVGEQKDISSRVLRSAVARGVQIALEAKRSQVSLILSDKEWLNDELASSCIEGALLGSYKFSKYKSEPPVLLQDLEIITETLNENEVKKTKSICEAVNYTRDLVNENASTMTPEQMAKEAKTLGEELSMKVTVLDEKEIEHQKLGLIQAVGQGSVYPPRLIIIEYNGNQKEEQKIAILGKGITFDSGGQNLKPSGSIETMREDMAGGATVLGIMKSIGTLKPNSNVIGVIAAAHNAIGSTAFFPGDIYRSYSGKTVEICNTDAEGRLVLADAISYCKDKYSPSTIVDLATLTGGVMVAFADVVAGLFSNHDKVAQDLFEAGEQSGERLWRLPLYQEYSESLKSDISDLRNLSKFKRGHASSIIGAAFLKEFVEDVPWAHIDIAGTAFNEGSAKAEIPQFGTGFGVRLLVNYLLKQ